MKYLFLIFILVSCESNRPLKESSEPEKPVAIEYEKVDIENVNDAFNLITSNSEKTRVNAQKGIDRGITWKPLFAKLIGVYNFGYTLTEKDLKPYMNDMQNIYSLHTADESKEFVRNGAENSQALNMLKKEADKGEINNQADELKDKRIQELEKIINTKVADKCNAIAEKFAYAGGVIMILSLFASWLPAVFTPKKVISVAFLFFMISGLLFLIGTAVDFMREFLEKNGGWLLLLLLVPLILLFVGKKGHDVFEEIKEDDKV